MLEFIIAILLSLGYNLEDKTIPQDLDADTLKMIQTDAEYEKLGGDLEFQTLYSSGEGSKDPEDNIVIGIDPNPPKE